MHGIHSMKNLVVIAYKHLLHFSSVSVNNRNTMAHACWMPSLEKKPTKQVTFLLPSTRSPKKKVQHSVWGSRVD